MKGNKVKRKHIITNTEINSCRVRWRSKPTQPGIYIWKWAVHKLSVSIDRWLNEIDDPESKGFLVPNFLNKPNVNDDDICTLEFDWGKEWYVNHFPVLDRSKSDRYIFLKLIECIITKMYMSTYKINILYYY